MLHRSEPLTTITLVKRLESEDTEESHTCPYVPQPLLSHKWWLPICQLTPRIRKSCPLKSPLKLNKLPFSKAIFSTCAQNINLPHISFHFISFHFIYFQREGRERNVDVPAKHQWPPTRDLTCSSGTCPDQESTWRTSVGRMMPSPLSHTSQG